MRTKDFQSNFTNGLVYTDRHGYEFLENSNLFGGELILPNIGASIGKVFLVPKLNYPMTLAPNSIMVKCWDEVTLIWLYFYFLSTSGQNALKNISSSTAQGKFNKTDFKGICIPVPPLNEQQRIVNQIFSIETTLSVIEHNEDLLKESIKFIKSRILDLAMQGKLVPQDPADEAAADMLRRINPKAKIIGDNPHYPQLPSGWCIATINDVFEINPKNKANGDMEAGFVPMTSICDGFNNSFVHTPRKWDEIKNGFTHFADGDIAVAKISPCLENRKSMILKNLPNGIGSGTTELLVFRSKVIYQEYGLLFFKSDNFIKQCVGTFNGVVGQQRVSKNIVEEIPIPIPPYKAQMKIANEVNRLFETLDQINSNLAN